MPLASLDQVSIAFGHLPLFDAAVLQIERGERIALVGRNGAGKSTLLQVLSGERPPDAGSVSIQPGTRIARLTQDVPLSSPRSVFEVVAEGLGPLSALVAAYHRAAVSLAESHSAQALAELGRLQGELEQRDGWTLEQRVELVLSRLTLPPDVPVDSLSGGWRRRVLLARALVSAPDLLLLDEPTNHLDLDAIEWLESFLAAYAGAVVLVTHDRAFLQRVATRIVEIERGRLTSWPGDYAAYLEKREAWLEAEAVRHDKFDKRLAAEEAWLRQGIKARRTRDEGRVRSLLAMREERAARRQQTGLVRLQLERGEMSGQIVFDVDGVSKAYGGRPVVRDLTLRVMRGDRIGVIGPNGAGKTTLLRLLVGDLAPDHGTITRGAQVQVAYFDQQREQLDPDRSLFDTIGDGNDTITVNGRTRHVNAYLRDFLFPVERAASPVRALSGGERNRLLLARLLTRPANVLVLDEPTNDLDLETLERLEQELVAFPGTLLIVSHDRAFLDNVVTSTLVFEGDGLVREYVGGYTDWVRQRPTPVAPDSAPAPARARPTAAVMERPDSRKLSYNERREYEELPSRIDALEAEQRELGAAVAQPDFYKEPAATITATLARLEQITAELTTLYARWDALDSRPR